MNRRVAAARGFFGYLVMAGEVAASPETTGRYVHLSPEHLAAEYAALSITLQGRP